MTQSYFPMTQEQIDYQEKVLKAYKRYNIENPWKQYVLDKLVVGGWYTATDDDNPIVAINKLIDMEQHYSENAEMIGMHTNKGEENA